MSRRDFEELKQYYLWKQRTKKDASGKLSPEEELKKWMRENGRL